MYIKESEKKVWTGKYKGVSFEINNFKFPKTSFDEQKDCWTHYIILHLDRIPEKYNPESFWLTPQKHEMYPRHISYEYHKHHIIDRIEFHGGCTWYSKEYGFENPPKTIKIGCDYQHYNDENVRYNLEYIKQEVIKSIDSFIEIIPDYMYWCHGNGKLYQFYDGIVNEYGEFMSNEYKHTKK